jgi:hypothetical protein
MDRGFPPYLAQRFEHGAAVLGGSTSHTRSASPRHAQRAEAVSSKRPVLGRLDVQLAGQCDQQR